MKKTIRVVGFIAQYEDSILLLHRSEKETDPSLWGIPAGKREGIETDAEAAIRELSEETGIVLNESEISYVGKLDIEYETVIVEFPIFHKKFNEAPAITLDPNEHVDYKWIRPSEALELPNLMLDVDKIIKDFCIDILKI
jgi:8-oxo-dGTP diphosphatase